jgi:S1-C subfamily serine protease
MASLLSSLSEELAAAVRSAAPSVVQVHGARRVQAGLVFDADLVMTSGRHLDSTAVSVRAADGRVLEGTLLGHGRLTGLAVVRVPGLGAPAAVAAPAPAPGHLAQAVGRTWSGGVFAAFAPVAVVGGPAARAGVLVGDVVVAFDGAPVDDPDELLARLRGARPGQAVRLTLSRGGAAHELTVTTGERPRG